MYKKRRIFDSRGDDDSRQSSRYGSMSENFEDLTGIVHYREHNFMRSPPGYDFKKKKSFSVKDKVCLKQGSLFKMCLKYMTINIDLIDSLVGMPEIIGKQLFSFMIKDGIFNFGINKDGSFFAGDMLRMKKLALFGEAYNDLVLKSLSLNKVQPNLNFMPLLCNFQYLVELDLSNRRLPSELFSVLATFVCLEKLILQETMLTDESVTKLTLPYRMYKDNPQSLEIIDIKNNKNVTNKSLELLLNFRNLKVLNVTETSVSMNFNLVYELKQFGWQISREEPTYSYPSNSGWAEPIITFLQQKPDRSEDMSNTKRFYSKPPTLKVNPCVNSETLILFHSNLVKKPVKFKTIGTKRSENRMLNHSKATKKLPVSQNKENNLHTVNKTFFDMQDDDLENIFDYYA